jgi:WD40 repeat protein
VAPNELERFATNVSCSPDVRRAAYGTSDGRVHVYDCASGSIIKDFPVGTQGVRVGSFSPDNRLIVVRKNDDRSGTIWNVEHEQVESTLPDAHFDANLFFNPTAFDNTFSPDGQLLAYVADGFSINLFDVETKRASRTLKGHMWGIWSMNFSPDGKLLASCSIDGDARVWDVSTGKETVLKGHRRGVTSVWFASDSRTLITGADDDSVRFWNVATGQETAIINGIGMVSVSLQDDTVVLWRKRGVSLLHMPTLSEIDAAEALARRP